MRRLPREINHSPKIFLLKFSHFFVFGGLAAVEQLLISDGLLAVVAIAATFGGFVIWEKCVPPHFVYYFLTQVKYFELEGYDDE